MAAPVSTYRVGVIGHTGRGGYSHGVDVAFATAIGHCVNIDKAGRREPLDFRLTMGLRKVAVRWQIMHEHHSLPAE